jgi:hypothetical protein
MNGTPHQTSCANCSASFVIERIFFLELAEAEHYSALQQFADPASQLLDCPECGQENPLDLHFSVYDPRINRLYHYLPSELFSNLDLTLMFNTEGDATVDLVSALLSDMRQRGYVIPETLGVGVSQNTFSLRVYLNPGELVQQVFKNLHVGLAHEEKAERYQKLEPPAEFLERGSKRYKRNQLTFIYRLGNGFEDGCTYSESDVDHIIRRERQYLEGCEMDESHVRVALIELQLLERTSDGRYYWRKPDADKIDGLCFPARVEGFEKSGYLFYGSPDRGFSVTYLDQGTKSEATFYVYGSPEVLTPAESIETEFTQAKDEIFQNYAQTNRAAVIADEKRLTLDKENGRAETVCHLTVCVNESDHPLSRSHLVVTSWRGRFIKVRMTVPDSFQNDDDILLRLITSLLRQLSHRDTSEATAC